MKKNLQKSFRVLALLLSLILIIMMIDSGCGTTENNETSMSETIPAALTDNENSEQFSETQDDINRQQTSNQEIAANIPNQKDETVYVKTDAFGTVQEITVQDILKAPNNAQTIQDYSTLDDIKNTKGDEEFISQKDGIILWENHGEDIYYEGKSEQELPLSVNISYYLNNQKINPEDIAGQSGKVRIRFDYTNHIKKTVQIQDTDVDVYVPFAAFSAMVLPSDTFSNIEVSNGKTISMDNQNIVIGYAFPGLADSLHLTEYEATEDISLPDYVEITADASDFELAFTATAISTGIFEDMDLSDLDTVDDLIDSMSELTDASGKLVDGTTELYEGMDTFQSYMSEYTQGVSQINTGVKKLADGLATLNTQKDNLQSGSEAIQDGLTSLNTALSKLSLPSEDNSSDSSNDNSAASAVQALAADVKTLAAEFTALQTSLTQIQSFAKDAAEYTATVQKASAAIRQNLDAIDLQDMEETATQKAREQVKKAVNAALEDSENLTDEEKAQIQKDIVNSIDISVITSEIQTYISAAQKELDTLPSLEIPDLSLDVSSITQTIEDMQTQLTALSQSSQAISQLSKTLSAIGKALEGLKTATRQLETGSKQLTKGIITFNKGIDQLYDGSAALSSGTSQLTTSGQSLNTGFAALVEGMKSLKDGVETFDKDGIQKLDDLAGDDLEDVITRLKAVQKADGLYTNFSGIGKHQTGSVKFIIETEEITSDNT